jgi:hypothetical protein
MLTEHQAHARIRTICSFISMLMHLHATDAPMQFAQAVPPCKPVILRKLLQLQEQYQEQQHQLQH